MFTDLDMNLQIFSQEKTEKPTPKKKKEAREKGQVSQSREVNSALVLLGCFVTIYLFTPYLSEHAMASVRYFLAMEAGDHVYTMGGINQLFLISITTALKIAGPIAGVALGIGLAANYAQVGFLFTTKTLVFKPNRLSPVEGFKRIFSRRAFVQMIKSLIKVGIIGYIVYRFLRTQYINIPQLLDMEVEEIALFIGGIVVKVGFIAGTALLLLAVGDYFYQKYEHQKGLMMTKQELKEEYKQIEGNPLIKSKIRENQRLISMRRMMTEIPKADVVITNPTHIAVVLKYDTKVADAPYVLAKGRDLIAMKIKEVARDNQIEIVENPPLARNLYNSTEIGSVIPTDLYQAVAEVLAFVYSLRRNG